jgi:hypothetical protein
MNWRVYFFMIFFVHGLFSQHNPLVTYYSSGEYQAHHQNWQVIESLEGKVFSANTSGLLQGNGNRWKLSKWSSNKIVRSVCVQGEKVFTGGHGEFGYWTEDICSEWKYTSLIKDIPGKVLENEEVWNIVAFKDAIYLQSFSVLLEYRNQQFRKIELPGSCMFLQFAGDKKFIPVLEKGIYELDGDNKTVLWPGSAFFHNKIVTGIMPFSDGKKYLISTNDHGVFLYDGGNISPWLPAFQQVFTEVQINKALCTKSGLYLLGSINGGLFVFSNDGKLLHHFHTGNGLYNNTVLALSEDIQGDIWVGLDKGMAKIQMSSKQRAYKDVNGDLGSVYTIREHEGIIYMGTNQGLYRYDKNNRFAASKKFTLVPGTQGQCWQLFTAGNTLYCGHNDGTLRIDEKEGKPISKTTGGWYNAPVAGTKEKLWLQGNYTGLLLFELKNGQLAVKNKIEGYPFPVKKFIGRNGQYWVTGPNLGLRRLTLDNKLNRVITVKKYDEKYNLPDADNIDLYEFRDTIRVWNGHKHYYYKPDKDIFVADPFFSGFAGDFMVRPVEKEAWIKIFQDYAVLMNGSETVTYLPVTMTIDYHNVAGLSGGEYLFCLDDGYFVQPVSVSGHAETKRDSPVFAMIAVENNLCVDINKPKLPGNIQSFSIDFYDYIYQKGKRYEYRVLPVQKEWKATYSMHSIVLDNYSPGDYVAEIKRNDGAVTTLPFTIHYPWYLSWPARILYLLLVVVFLYLAKKYHESQLTSANIQHEAEQSRLKRQHEVELENQRLMHENKLKSRELANSAMQLVQKNEILLEIKNELIDIRKSSNHTLTTKDFQVLMKQINDNLTVKEDKKLFDTQFSEIHESFLATLKKKFPMLTKDDLKLAVYLRMEMSTKEIAPLFNLSVRGLENKRYRLRKKLELPLEENLNTYLQSIE